MRKFSPLVRSLITALAFVPVLCLGQAARSTILVNIAPDTTAVASSEAVQFTALVKNTPNVAVKWSASAGTISGTGLYRAPKVSSDTVVTVKATSVSDPTKSSVDSITVSAPKAAQATPVAAVNSTSKTSTTIKESFFGADVNGFQPWPPTDGQNQIATLGSVRLWDDNVKWAQIETSKGVYDWANLDSHISKIQAQNADVLYTIGNTPQWAGSIPPKSPCGPQGAYSCSSPTDVNTDGTGKDAYFSDFITALVTRYKGQIAYYELWNEPDCTCYWSGTYAQIVRMGQDAAAIIRSIDPNAK